MKKLNFYLGSTVGLTTLLAFGGLIGLFAIFTFLDQMEDIKGQYTIGRALLYVGYSLPRMFYETLPYATLIGCLTGLGLLASNSELIVMRAAGISTWHISRAVMIPTLAFVIVGLLAGEFVLPDFERTARAIREEARADDITPTGGFWYRENQVFMHFNTVSHDGELTGIHQYIAEGNMLSGTRFATRASYNEESGNWTLYDVTETRIRDDGQKQPRLGSERGFFDRETFDHEAFGEKTFNEKTLNERLLNEGLLNEEILDRKVLDRKALDEKTFEQVSFDELLWETTLTPEILSTEILVEPNKMSIMELKQKIDHLAAQGLNTGKFETGFYTKLLQPIASLSLVLVAISFIFGPLRDASMGMRVFSGLVIGLFFKFAQDLLSPASLVFGFSPLIATLLPILLCMAAGYLLLRRAS